MAITHVNLDIVYRLHILPGYSVILVCLCIFFF